MSSADDLIISHLRDAQSRERVPSGALRRLAEAAGDTTTASLARSIRADEDRYLAGLRELVEPLAERVARMNLGGAGAAAPARPAPEAAPEREPEPAAGEANGGPVTTERETPHRDR